MDLDATGADISGENQINLSPASGLDPGLVVRSVPSAAQSVYPDPVASITTTGSVTALPRGTDTKSLMAQPGQPVDLRPPNPTRNMQTAQVAPVVPAGSVAPQTPVAPLSAPAAIAPAAPRTPNAQRPGSGQGMFGSELVVTPGFDPNKNPLQARRDGLAAQADRLDELSSRKGFQFMRQGTAMKMQQEVARLRGEVAQIDQQIQTQTTNQQYGNNMNLKKVMSATADAAAFQEQAIAEWKGGNFGAYKGLVGAGQGARADLYTNDAMRVLGKEVTTAQGLYDDIANSRTQAEYIQRRQMALEEARKSLSGTNNDKTFGLTEKDLPKTLQEFKSRRPEIAAGLNSAKLFTAEFANRQAQLTQAVPITDEKIAKPTLGRFTFSDSSPIPGTTAVTLPELGQAKGAEVSAPGSKDLANRGSGEGQWNTMTDDVRKNIKTQFEGEESKGAIGQYKMAKSFHHAAHNDKLYNYPAGIAFIEDELGAIGRDVAEGSKAAGSIGLVKILEGKYGTIDHAMNSLTNNWGAYRAWVQGGRQGAEVKLEPRVTPQTIEGYKTIADFKLYETKKELMRLEGPIGQLAKHGGSLSGVGLDKTTQELLSPIYREAFVKGTLDIDKFPAMIKGDRRILLDPDVYVPPGTPGFVPAGSYAKTLQNLPTTPAVNSPGGGGPTAPVPPGGGGGGPITPVPSGGPGGPLPTPTPVVAPGGPPPVVPAGGGGPNAYSVGIKAGESGNRYDAPPPLGPDGKQISSASGAYAFIDETWAANKPPGAPDQAYKATREQQDAAFETFTRKNLAALQKAGLPTTSVNLALLHQQGAGGGMALAKAADTDVAFKLVDRQAAANNAKFFWEKDTGRPLTVAETKAKFAQHYRLGSDVVLPYPNPKSKEEVQANARAGQRLTPEEAKASAENRQKRLDSATKSAARIAPAALGTAGAVIGSAAGPPGAIIGGTLGGAGGGAIEHYFTGKPEEQTPSGYVKPAAIGAAKGLVAGIPGMGPAATAGRVGLSAAVGGGEEYLKGGTTPEIVNAAGGSALGSLGGEMFGQALGKTFGMIYSRFSNVDKTEIREAAKVLATQKAKNTLADGSTVENTTFTKAEKTVKEAGIDPEFAAHAHNETSRMATKGEALTTRPSEVGRIKAAAELEKTRNTVSETAAAARVVPKPVAPGAAIPDGPLSTILTPTNPKGKLSPMYTDEASYAEGLLKKPVANMGARYDNAADARTFLLEQERKALRDGDDSRVKAMRAIADNVREYQEKMVKTLLPKKQADDLIAHLKKVDDRYRRAIMAGGDDIVATIAKGGAKSNQAKAAFEALAGNDPAARRMMTALVKAEEGIIKKYGALSTAATVAYASAHIPLVGPLAAGVATTIGVIKAKELLLNWAARRGSGDMVTFKQLVLKDITPTKSLARSGSSAIGGAAGAEAAKSAAQPASP